MSRAAQEARAAQVLLLLGCRLLLLCGWQRRRGGSQPSQGPNMQATAVRANGEGDPILLGAGLFGALTVIICLQVISARSSVSSQERAITDARWCGHPAGEAPG